MNARTRNKIAAIAGLFVSFACGGKDKQAAVPGPSISSFRTSPTTPIPLGAKASLEAVFDGGDGIVQPGAIPVASRIPFEVSPTSNTTYTLQVTNRANVTATATTAVVVETMAAMVGTAGGVIETPAGATVAIPFGALDKPTQITVSATTAVPPPGIEARGPVYRFEPTGILFARPVKVSLPLPTGATSGAIYWSRLGTSDFSSFDSLGGTVAAGSISVDTPHFSLAVIGPATPKRTVVGVGQTTWISATTRDSEPIDFASQGVEALVSDANGNLVSIPGVAGTGVQAGTFVISDVPQGEYMLHSGTEYLVTSTSSPDLGTQQGGRPARFRTPLTASAQLSLTVDGLDPWQSGDQLEFFVSEENDWDFDTERLTRLTAGNTTVSVDFDVSRIIGGKPSTIHAQGDHAYIAQLSGHTLPSGPTYVAMSRIAQLPPFDLAGGGAVAISVTMSDVSAANTLTVDYRGTQWESVLADGNPTQQARCNSVGIACKSFLGVLAQPGSPFDGFYSSNADLLLLFDFTGDSVLEPLNYGSPPSTTLTGNWGTIFSVSRSAAVFPTLILGTSGYGAGLFRGLPSGASWTTTPEVVNGTAQTSGVPVAPPISMPIDSTVNELPFFTDTTGIGLTPTIAWSPPKHGIATFYVLNVLQFGTSGTLMTATRVAQIITPDLSVTLPAGILAPATRYAFTLSAKASTGPTGAVSLAAAPFRSGIDIADATTSSGTFVP